MAESFSELKRVLNQIDGKSYRAYKDLQGKRYRFDGEVAFVLSIDHVQGDPFAAPSRLSVRVPREAAGFPEWCDRTDSRRIGLETFLAKEFSKQCRRATQRKGSGKSGNFGIDTPGQEVIQRTAVMVDDVIEVRFSCGLPAAGRRALGRNAADMLCDSLPSMVANGLSFSSLDEDDLRQAVEVNEDAESLRGQLEEHRLVAFVADGSILPRRSGIDQRAMAGAEVVGFQSPESLRVTIEVPNAGAISGMGIPEGITLIVGGGFHGKSTLLNALERGVYNHCPNDGREKVVTRVSAMKIRAEDGRSVAGVNISPFINNLPGGADTFAFSTPNASGSTSQAANIVESLEAGSDVLLIDEDIAATNFMIRDERMQALVAKEKEPITPFIEKVGPLYQERGVSSILVIGGSGDYFRVADTVIMMDEYVPLEVTERAREIAQLSAVEPSQQAEKFGGITHRIPNPESMDASKGRRDRMVKVRSWDEISFGRETIDLSGVSQLVSESQTRAIGAALLWALDNGVIDGNHSLAEILDQIEMVIESDGLDALTRQPSGSHAKFRRHELAATMNRLRALKLV
ncbi:MAG: ABC-ATPase domain-containing protein [Verrucomicrobiota bacterium]